MGSKRIVIHFVLSKTEFSAHMEVESFMEKKEGYLLGKNLIGGKLRESVSGVVFEIQNPATGQVIGEAPFSNEVDVAKATQIAKIAQKEWKKLLPRERGKHLLKVAEVLEMHKEELARLMALETGKAIRTESRIECEALVDTFEFFGGLGSEIKGETIPFNPKMLTMTIRQPIGIIGAILPWNAPLMLMAFKIAPALLCGNAVVIKSAEQCPLITLRAVELINEVLPKGLCNLISGDGLGTGAALVNCEDINMITFTGSVSAGKEVYSNAGKRLVPVTLELGGKSPMIVASDANLEKAVMGAVLGMRFTRQGQSCTAASRIFVHEALYDEFLEKMLESINKLVIGDPMNETTDIGAIISQEQLKRIEYFVKQGESCGTAHYCCQLPKEAHLKKGYFHRPVIFTGIRNSDEIAKEEIFGPVTCLFKWNDLNEVIRQANDTRYGLGATIWTRDLSLSMKLIDELEAGFVQVNQHLVVRPGLPFGGIKESGIGKEASLEDMLEHFTQKKTVIINKE